jgi:hypothetical protein
MIRCSPRGSSRPWTGQAGAEPALDRIGQRVVLAAHQAVEAIRAWAHQQRPLPESSLGQGDQRHVAL